MGDEAYRKFSCLIWANLFHFVPSAPCPARYLGVLQLHSYASQQSPAARSNKRPGNPSSSASMIKDGQQMLLGCVWWLCRLVGISAEPTDKSAVSAPQLTFCNHCVLFTMALSRLSSFCSCQEGLSCWVLSAADRLASVDACGGESLWRVLLTLKSFEGRQWSTSGRMNV